MNTLFIITANYISVCMCVCVYIYIYIYIYMCERERERKVETIKLMLGFIFFERKSTELVKVDLS